MATRKNFKLNKPQLRRPDTAALDAVRNPNFEPAMAMQNYRNSMEDQQARLALQGGDFTQGRLMGAPSGQGGLGGLTADQAGIPADQRKILDDLMATQQGGNMAGMPITNQPPRPNPAMGQMANYNQMLQQGMQRNTEMNQAAQNLTAPAGPARSFSQVAGGINRMNRMPRQPRNNSLAPSNQKLI